MGFIALTIAVNESNMFISCHRQLHLVAIMLYFPEIPQPRKYCIMTTRWSMPIFLLEVQVHGQLIHFYRLKAKEMCITVHAFNGSSSSSLFLASELIGKIGMLFRQLAEDVRRVFKYKRSIMF